ncbi:MAG: hypothetical protein PHY28_06495 [Dehalococcoidales bacterium]|nr:hypothetical protein [Dehalococcoidales bacterium]
MSRNGITEKISVTLPRELAGEIRNLVPQGEVSAFFTEALTHYIALKRQKKALGKGFGAWKDKNHTDLVTTKDTSEFVYSIRKNDRSSALYVNESKNDK